MLGQEALVVLVRAADPALGVDLVLDALALARLELHLLGQVVVFRAQQPSGDVAVDRLLAHREQARVVHHRGVDRLALQEQLVQRRVERRDLRFAVVVARARLHQHLAVVLLRRVVLVVLFAQHAPRRVPAAVAYPGRARELLAGLLDELPADPVAQPAQAAAPVPVVEAVRAELARLALHPVRAPVRHAPEGALLAFRQPRADLPHDGLGGPAQLLGDRVGSLAGLEPQFDLEPVPFGQSWFLHVFPFSRPA